MCLRIKRRVGVTFYFVGASRYQCRSDTFRGECLRRYGSQVSAASWDSVIFDLPGRESLQRIPTVDPLRGTRAHVAALLDSCETAEALSRVTELLAVVSAPAVSTSTLRHIEILALQPRLAGGIGGPENRSRNYAIVSLGFSGAGFIGPLIAGFSIDYLGHLKTFMILAAFTVIPVLMLLRNPGFLPGAAASAPVLGSGCQLSAAVSTSPAFRSSTM